MLCLIQLTFDSEFIFILLKIKEITRDELGLANDQDLEGYEPNEDTSHGNDEALIRTGRLFGGLIADVKRKSKWFISDFTDALNFQSVAAIIYIYLATITKAITFGGFLGDITDGRQVKYFFSELKLMRRYIQKN